MAKTSTLPEVPPDDRLVAADAVFIFVDAVKVLQPFEGDPDGSHVFFEDHFDTERFNQSMIFRMDVG